MDTDRDYVAAEATRLGEEYRGGKWVNCEDEKGAEGFWDLAGELAYREGDKEELQELIYVALQAATDKNYTVNDSE